jgi:hypothetical protein
MPSFTFEKISSPSREPLPSGEKKRRGLIVKVLDRLTEAREKRPLREKKGVVAPLRQQQQSD